jgi:hypothetical protein
MSNIDQKTKFTTTNSLRLKKRINKLSIFRKKLIEIIICNSEFPFNNAAFRK